MILSTTILIAFILYLLWSFFFPKKIKRKIRIWVLGIRALIAGLSLFYWVLKDCPTYLITINWLNSQLQTFAFSFIIDYNFVVFRTAGLFVTWSIIEFSHYYMKDDPHKQAFINTLILFLLLMLILVSANSLITLFIGWEGVGFLSFILIGWWFTRSDAKRAALQAIIYNRIGDRGMILFIVLSMLYFNSWNLKDIIYSNLFQPLPCWALLGIIVAATGKSAQFILHPWLPSAMEGPTPVSALLHSSTMVVAGVFLIIRCFPLLSLSQWSLRLLRILGSITALFAARTALGQFDIKKIVAYSTTSQLGLMVTAVGLGLPWLALFHICTHAFFKSLLFLCSGRIIHSLNKEQDLRKMGGAASNLPFTTRALVIGRLALCGFPFLAGYYSKDLILEAGQINICNRIRVILALIATLMTAIYSFRIVSSLCFTKPLTPTKNPIREENFKLYTPLLRLLRGVFLSGWCFSLTLFFSSSMIVPLLKKSLPLFLTLTAGLLIFCFSFSLRNNSYISISFFISSKWYYVQITHVTLFINAISRRIQGVLRNLDQGWTALLGPAGSSSSISKTTMLLRPRMSGKVLNYIFYSLFAILVLGSLLLV